MHNEKNMFDNIFNTVMDIKEKSKDNMNARKDLAIICNLPELQVDERRPNVMPKVVYTLTKDQKRKVCEWVKCLRFSNGYASNLSRCVDMTELRFLCELKKKVKNKEHIEASIVEAYIVEEIGWFTSHYFEPHVTCKRCRPSRNDDLTREHERIFRNIFNHRGRPSGVPKKRYVTGQERHIMRRMYCVTPKLLRHIMINNELWSVCVKSSSYRDTENDFYGILEEIIELDYPLNNDLHVVIFKCRWVDPTRGLKVHPHYHLVDVNFKRVYQKDEPFILAQQAVQVYYTEYPSTKRDKIDWMAVCKTKARRFVDESRWTNVVYQIEEDLPVPEVNTNNQTHDLHDPDGLQLIVDLTSTMQHRVGISRANENDKDKDEEDSFDNYETDEKSDEQDNKSD
ncbi:UNVERIFIED_CONTAM: hypothetical protein Sradi_2055000 [Sesamum radiatum]|uniref:DUF4216 domain-containing protein n=1 Tax=Sesamum radiatum TaxID=300843 RepID=A0AAW2THS3_SESRA